MFSFQKFLKATFEVGTLACSQLSLIGCVITRHEDGTVKLSHSEKLRELDSHILGDAVSENNNQSASESQTTLYLHVIVNILFISRSSAPVMLMHAAMAAVKFSDLKLHYLRTFS